jgi:hypothetical protein
MTPADDASLLPASGCPRQAGEQSLAAARSSSNYRREALALADLGIMHLYEGDAPQAVAFLEDALVLLRQFGDCSWDSDLLGQLGLATAAAGEHHRGLEILDVNRRFKTALPHSR